MPMACLPGVVPMPGAAPQQSNNQGNANPGHEFTHHRPQLPTEPRQAERSSKPTGNNVARAPSGGKKNTALSSGRGNNTPNGQPACPVAVYVDLSTLRERGA